MNYSKTQITNIVTLVMFFIQAFDINISDTEVESIVTALAGLGAIGYALYLRWRKGDIKLLGAKKYRR